MPTISMKRSEVLLIIKRSIEIEKYDNALAILDSIIEQEKEIEKEEEGE